MTLCWAETYESYNGGFYCGCYARKQTNTQLVQVVGDRMMNENGKIA